MRKWLHRALKGASLTTALFVFQACYGTPPGPYMEEMEATDVELVEEADEVVDQTLEQTTVLSEQAE
jgi:hypothetical protein